MAQRKYLNLCEIEALLSATLKMPHPERNHCLILMGYLHGFRASELLGIKMSDIDLQAGNLNIRRLKTVYQLNILCRNRRCSPFVAG